MMDIRMMCEIKWQDDVGRIIMGRIMWGCVRMMKAE